MDKHQFEILDQIKQRFLASCESADFQVSESGADRSARQFYLRDLDDNLVRPMHEKHIAEYSRGSGSELDGKMKALRSSSAMTFNILGNLQREVAKGFVHGSGDSPLNDLFASDSYSIEYEYQLPTLKYGLPANLDALLIGDTGDVIACEMKMLEWLTSTPAKLKSKYLDVENCIHRDTASAFVEVASELNGSDSFSRYDFAQMFKHALALYNAARSEKLQANRIVLLNCVWEPPENYELSDDTNEWLTQCKLEEHAGFNEFKRAMASLESSFSSGTGLPFEIQYRPADKLISCLDYPLEERLLLARYL